MTGMFIAIVAFAAILLGVISISLISNVSTAKVDLKSFLLEEEGFEETKTISSDRALLYFAVDEKQQEIFCYSNGRKVRFRYKDLVAIELKIDDDVTVSDKSASVGGALVGGLIAGGLGAVVGGSAMGNVVSKKEVSTVNVHILLRDNTVQGFDIECLNTSERVSVDDILYKEACAKAQEIYDVLRLAIDAVEKSMQPQTSSLKSIVDELKELVELKQQGLLTDEEFSAMKAKILSK